MEFHWIDPPKISQNFVEKAHYPDATPLKNSIRTHSIPVCMYVCMNGRESKKHGTDSPSGMQCIYRYGYKQILNTTGLMLDFFVIFLWEVVKIILVNPKFSNLVYSNRVSIKIFNILCENYDMAHCKLYR